MKRIILLVICISLSVAANAQLTKERIVAEPGIANGYHHSYQSGDRTDTKAPKGYTPFYISHVGRHGSRYDLGDGGAFDMVYKTLSEARNHGSITDTGEKLLGQIEIMTRQADGMYEMLTSRGAREHREIASRMVARFPQVFASKQRTEVDAVSSTVQRCVLSMSNFMMEVQREKPQMKVTMDTGDKYMSYLMVWDSKGRSQQKTVRPDSEKYLHDNLDPSRLMSSLFKGDAAVDPYEFSKNLYTCASYTETMDLEMVVDIRSFFTLDEFYVLACNDSDVFYTQNGNSLLYGDVTALQGRKMLKDIISKADEAISGNKRAADLRFTHDTALLPLCTLLSFSGMDMKLPQTSAHEQWCCGDNICMGSNLQLIFYQDRKGGDVLVKVLYNEQERYFSQLDAVSGPYYRWADFKAYFSRILTD